MEHFTSRISRPTQELVNVYVCVCVCGGGVVVVEYQLIHLIGPPPPQCDTNINLTKRKTCDAK